MSGRKESANFVKRRCGRFALVSIADFVGRDKMTSARSPALT